MKKVKLNIPQEYLDVYNTFGNLFFYKDNTYLDENIVELNGKIIEVEIEYDPKVYITKLLSESIEPDIVNIPKKWCEEVRSVEKRELKSISDIIEKLDRLEEKLNSIQGEAFQNKCRISELDNKMEAIFRTK